VFLAHRYAARHSCNHNYGEAKEHRGRSWSSCAVAWQSLSGSGPGPPNGYRCGFPTDYLHAAGYARSGSLSDMRWRLRDPLWYWSTSQSGLRRGDEVRELHGRAVSHSEPLTLMWPIGHDCDYRGTRY
jgi:hypothetical protein